MTLSPGATTMPMIPLEDVGFDPRYYPRANGLEDWFTVNRYRDALLSDDAKQFPSVVVVRVHDRPYKYLVLDGKHRLAAYLKSGREEIPAEVERLPESKWFARSVELNVTHGRALDKGDKAWVALRLEKEGHSVEGVARLLQMRVESLEKIKADCIVKLRASGARLIPAGRGNRRVGNDHYGFLKAPFKGSVGNAAVEALGAQGPVAAHDVLHVLDSCIAVLQCGVDTADVDVAMRIERIRELLPTSVVSG
jgi:hypothetical protein